VLVARGSRAGAGYGDAFVGVLFGRRLRNAAVGSDVDGAPPTRGVAPGVLLNDAVPLSTLPTTRRVPAARIGALERGIAWPRKSGEASRTTKAPRVRTSMCVTLTTFTLTKPLPKRPCGTTVHARQGS
jgi:hypothetical protein